MYTVFYNNLIYDDNLFYKCIVQVRIPQSDVEFVGKQEIYVKSINKTFVRNEFTFREEEENVTMYCLCADDYYPKIVTSNGISVKEIDVFNFIRNVFYQFVILPYLKGFFQ